MFVILYLRTTHGSNNEAIETMIYIYLLGFLVLLLAIKMMGFFLGRAPSR